MVHVALKNEDKSKVDLGNLTGAIVKVVQDMLPGVCCCEIRNVKVLVCVSQDRPSDWKGQQCRIKWLDRCIEWVGVNEDHLGKGVIKKRIYCGRSTQG